MTRAIVDGIAIALDSLAASKVRAALTMLGITIGVTVVIAMASTIAGINRGVLDILEATGPKTFYVLRQFLRGVEVSDDEDDPAARKMPPPLTVEEAELIRRLPSVRGVNLIEMGNLPVSAGTVSIDYVQIAGLSPTWLLVSGGEMLGGRTFTLPEYAAAARVVVVNQKAGELLFPGLDPIGKRVKIGGEPFEVVGRYAEAASLFRDSDRLQIAIPHTTYRKLTGGATADWMHLAVIPTAEVTTAAAVEDVAAALRIHRGLRPTEPDNFGTLTQDRLLEHFTEMTSALFLAMMLLSSLSLVVGGVGVVAIMTISVTERTREIGVRKALGATRSEIMFQFLVEAATLTLMGCLAGLALGMLIAWGIRTFSPIPATTPLLAVVAALVAAIGTGMLFGLYPASRAARLDPVEALRHE